MNRTWHAEHRLDPRASLDQRIDWHVEHAQQCGCREMPDSIKRELQARNLPIPERRQ